MDWSRLFFHVHAIISHPYSLSRPPKVQEEAVPLVSCLCGKAWDVTWVGKAFERTLMNESYAPFLFPTLWWSLRASVVIRNCELIHCQKNRLPKGHTIQDLRNKTWKTCLPQKMFFVFLGSLRRSTFASESPSSALCRGGWAGKLFLSSASRGKLHCSKGKQTTKTSDGVQGPQGVANWEDVLVLVAILSKPVMDSTDVFVRICVCCGEVASFL